MGSQLNTAENRNPEIVYRCRSADEAEDLTYGLKQLFPDLDFKLQPSNLDIYARQGAMQSIHQYLDERNKVKQYIDRLSADANNYKTRAYQLAKTMLKGMLAQLSKDSSQHNELQKKQGLLDELQTLENDPGFWVLCRQIFELELEYKTT